MLRPAAAHDAARRQFRRWPQLLCVALLLIAAHAPAASPDPAQPAPDVEAASPDLSVGQEPITPIPQPPAADPRKVALGQQLFEDPRLSRDESRACSSCHDVHHNGADGNRRDLSLDGKELPFNTDTVFNAALSFRYNWEGSFRTLEAQAAASIGSSDIMGMTLDEVVRRLNADSETAKAFYDAYDGPATRDNLLDAIATYERSLLTPGSRFDRWLEGDASALSPEEKNGYRLFRSLGCISCHQGVNVGGNLFERYGVFQPMPASRPVVLRVPSLRNVATTPPYFHDGSAPTLREAVRRMGRAQLDRTLTDDEIGAIVAFLGTLTGTYQGAPVTAVPR